jgi:hypothetical protein
MRILRVLAILLVATCALAKQRKDVPLAPLPAKVVAARTVFLTNAGGSDLAFDAFYSKMKSWGRFEIVDTPEKADLIFELSYMTVRGGTRVWSSTNTYDGSTQVHSAAITDPQVLLTIFDGENHAALWSTVEHRRLARLQRNREKETINAAERIVSKLKTRLERQSAAR